MVKVSVVIPVYNVEDYLVECMDSIVNQTLEDIEIICVNDGSTDKSLDILKEYAARDSRISVYSQENRGHAVATNRGMKLAKGKYLYLMDSDDILKVETALEDTYKIAEEKNLDFIIFQAINYYMDKNEFMKKENYSMNALADFVGDRVFNWKDIKDYIFTITVTPWSKLYNREFIERSGARFPEGLVFEDNVFFWEVLFSAERISFYRECLFVRRWHSSSSTVSGGPQFKDSIQVMRLVWDVFKKFNVFKEFEEILYHRRIDLGYMRFRLIRDEFKEDYLIELRDSFDEIKYENNFGIIFNKLSQRDQTIFSAVFKSNNAKELLEAINFFDNNRRIKNLRNDNNELNNEINSLMKINAELNEKLNESNNNDMVFRNYVRQIDELRYENYKLKTSNEQLEKQVNDLKHDRLFFDKEGRKILSLLQKFKKKLMF